MFMGVNTKRAFKSAKYFFKKYHKVKLGDNYYMQKIKINFLTHPKSKCWDYSKNIKSPEEVSLTSTTKFWFICDKCAHSFDICPSHVNRGV